MKKQKKDTFRAYDSIDNHYNAPALNAILNHPEYDPTSLWYASEKVHGANFSFSVFPVEDELTVKIASRNQYLDSERWIQKFYPQAQKSMKERYTDHAIRAYKYINEHFGTKYNNISKVVIYGEVFGGLYPHDQVPVEKAAIIQRGVFYCPHNDFYPFDIYVVYGENEGAWMDFDDFKQVMDACDYKLYAKDVFRGTLEECLKLDVEKSTNIPEFYNLPTIEKNISEGLVLKPLISFVNKETNTRWVIKKKSINFIEIMQGDKLKTFLSQNQAELLPLPTEECKQAQEFIASYVTDTRIDNIRSKMTEDFMDRPHFIGKAQGLLAQDVLKDFAKDHAELWCEQVIKKEDQHTIKKNLNTLCNGALREYVRNNLIE